MLGFYGEEEVQFDENPSVDPGTTFQPTVPMETSSTLQPKEENVVSVITEN